jgi:hypothetical protein
MAWIVTAVDENAQEHTFFLRSNSVLSKDEAEVHGRRLCRNWTFMGVKWTPADRPPAHARKIEPRAFRYGALEQLNSLRRR